MSDSSSLSSYDMVKEETGSLSDFEHSDAPLVEQRKSPKMEELMKLVEKELAEQDESEEESDDESNVCAESTDGEDDAEVDDELLVELMKPLAQEDQKILEPVSIDIPEIVPEVKELVIPEGKVLVDEVLLEEIKLLREPKELVIPEGMVLVDEAILEEVEELRESDEAQKQEIEEKSKEVEALKAKKMALDRTILCQNHAIKMMKMDYATRCLAGKWRLVSMKEPFNKDTQDGVPIARRFLNLVAPMYVSLEEVEIKTWQQICGKRFNKTSVMYEVTEWDESKQVFEAEYDMNGRKVAATWVDQAILKLSDGKKVYVHMEDMLMATETETPNCKSYMAYKKVEKKADIFRSIWKAAQTITGKHFATVI